jgi:DNA primase
MFPIRDSRGRVIAFGGRVLGDDKPKYLNSPETPVFHKGQELYGLYEVRQHSRSLDEIMVVEGYMDVIALAQQGLRHAVATLGTATSEEHIKRLFRVVPNILFCFDGDRAGRAAAWRALESCLPALQDGRRVRFLFLPEGEDPDSLVRREGEEAFRARMAREGRSLADYFFQHLSAEADPDSLEGKAHLASLALPLIEKVPGANLKKLMLQHLSTLTGLASEQLGGLVAAPVVRAPARTLAADEQGADAPPSGWYEDQPPPAWESMEEAPRSWQPERRERPEPRERGRGRPERNGVEPPTISALRTLLHHPQLAQKVEDASNFAAEDDQLAQLLVALLESLQKQPGQTPLQLLARWHGTEQGALLRSLAEKEWLIGPDNLERQFFDTISRLIAQQREQQQARELDALLARPLGELDDKEKARLRELLAARHAGG